MKNNEVIIRLENKKDYREVETLARNSFWNVYCPGCSEHYVLHKLRSSDIYIPELSFVLEKDGVIIGQNIFVHGEIKLNNGNVLPVLTMGPICVAYEYQRQGYGKKLLDYSLARAKELGYQAVCIEGDINFYSKSGFILGSTKGLKYRDIAEGKDAYFFLVKELVDGYLDGISGTYGPAKEYFVDLENPSEFEEYDQTFPYKEKLKLPGQLS